MSRVDLEFGGAYTPPPGNAVNLDFSPAQSQLVSMALYAIAPTPRAEIGAAIFIDAELVARSSAPRATVDMRYDINVWRGPSSRPAGNWQPAQQTSPASSGLFQSTTRLRAIRKQPWEDAARRDWRNSIQRHRH